ncbi:MAG: 5'-nucleotidase C-terminal domain-containing protein, partial [Firmicutes bacterium]|nr:5'-nucleotidase C-terminal domain-containing protein [Bacillota bacterium]
STVDAANQAVAQLHRKGVHTILLLAHLGTDAMMDPDGSKLVTDPSDIAKNEAAALARAVDDDVDLIVSGHTHQGVNTYVDGKLIVQAYAYGTAYADVTLRINTHSRDVVDQAHASLAPIANEVVGQAAVPLTRDQTLSPGSTQGIGGESNLGDVVADAMLEGAKKLESQVTFAFMNAGGIRTDIPQGPITRGKVIEVLPFQNVLATVTLSGNQVKAVLEQGASGQHGMVQVAGLHFSYDPNQPVGSRITRITLAGTDKTLDPNGTYRIVTNDFMLNGGDNYVTFQQGKDPVIHSDALLSDVVVQYIQAHTPIDQQIEGRITVGH